DLLPGVQVGRDRGKRYRQVGEGGLDELLAEDLVDALALDDAAAQAEVRELEHALAVDAERKGFHLVEAPGGERRADECTHGAARDEVGLDAGVGERPQHADVRPAARGARTEGETDLRPARHYCIRAHRSW